MPYIPPDVVTKAKEMDLLTYLKNYEPGELVLVFPWHWRSDSFGLSDQSQRNRRGLYVGEYPPSYPCTTKTRA